MMSNVLQSNSEYSQVNDKSSKWRANDKPMNDKSII